MIGVPERQADMLDLLVVLAQDLLRSWQVDMGKPDYDSPDKEAIARYNTVRVRMTILIGKLLEEYGPLVEANDGLVALVEEINAKATMEFDLWQIKMKTDRTDPDTIPND